MLRLSRYGPVWRTNIIGMTGVFFHGPQAFKTVMLGEHTLFTYKVACVCVCAGFWVYYRVLFFFLQYLAPDVYLNLQQA